MLFSLQLSKIRTHAVKGAAERTTPESYSQFLQIPPHAHSPMPAFQPNLNPTPATTSATFYSDPAPRMASMLAKPKGWNL